LKKIVENIFDEKFSFPNAKFKAKTRISKKSKAKKIKILSAHDFPCWKFAASAEKLQVPAQPIF